ncbi:MAG: DUF2079 domain-containing protein [Chloroflexi bacterium]|nr:MAG: DUF2079 domain-containing protein [Chloroflexota bacterium]
MARRGLPALSRATLFVRATSLVSQLRIGLEPLSVRALARSRVGALSRSLPHAHFAVITSRPTPSETSVATPRESAERANARTRERVTLVLMTAAWAAGFSFLAVQRHLAGGSHAEDLGFTDQVLNNFLRGQWFRMSVYQGATWNTELDIGRIARPDSLLAFHVEPMLLLLVPIYAIGGGVIGLLVLQAVALAAGAIPAYRLARHATGSALPGVAVATAYLLSPLGQWAVLADFHTSTIAPPLLLLAVERLVVGNSAKQALAAAAVALTAREDVGPVVAALGVAVILLSLRQERVGRADHAHSVTQPSRERHVSVTPASRERLASVIQGSRQRLTGVTQAAAPVASAASPAASAPTPSTLAASPALSAPPTSASRERHAGVMQASRERHARVAVGIALAAMGFAWTVLSAVIINMEALTRKSMLDYAGTLLLSGGWLGPLAPLALLPALPGLALNALSTSPWMAAGKAHYSGLVLPFVAVGAAAGLWQLRHHPRLVRLASLGLIASSIVGYFLEGAGPFGGNYAPAVIDEHARRAASIATTLPADATVSASSALVPRVSRRAGVYVFPAVLDADFIFLDLRASPAPTSAGDVFLRVQDLLASGNWQLQQAEDGLLVLQRSTNARQFASNVTSVAVDQRAPVSSEAVADASSPASRDAMADPSSPASSEPTTDPSSATTNDAANVTLLSATLLPSPDGEIDVDGPRAILRTVWRTERALPAGTRLEFWVDLKDGQRLHLWDIASLWWNPPERWTPGETVTVDVPNVPARQFQSWQASWTDPQ